MVRAALDGRWTGRDRLDPIFRFAVRLCPDVPASFLDPRSTWSDTAAYDRQAASLPGMFVDNFAAYAAGVTDDAIRDAGPAVADWTPPADPRPEPTRPRADPHRCAIGWLSVKVPTTPCQGNHGASSRC